MEIAYYAREDNLVMKKKTSLLSEKNHVIMKSLVCD